MPLTNCIFFDFSLDQKYILILSQDKLYKKKLDNLKRSENIANIFFEFIKKNQIKIDNSFSLFVNVGPGNMIAIRNSVVFTKILPYSNKVVSTRNFGATGSDGKPNKLEYNLNVEYKYGFLFFQWNPTFDVSGTSKSLQIPNSACFILYGFVSKSLILNFATNAVTTW